MFKFVRLNKLVKYLRFIPIMLLGLFLASAASAQVFTTKGVIFKKNTPEVVPQVVITNETRKIIAMSDELGGFHIQAAIGDSLVFKKEDYTIQTIVLLTRIDQTIYMQPIIHLDNVTIKGVSRQQELNDVLNDYKKKNGVYSLNPSAWSVLNSPITGLYELFGKSAAQARKFRAYTKEEMDRIAIAKRYNKELVKKITDIPDTEMQDFMLTFTPSVEDIKVWSDYDIITYIKRSYEYFKDNKGRLKTEKLY